MSLENAKLCTMSLEKVERVNPIATDPRNIRRKTPRSSSDWTTPGWM